jgi:hypothetical protein
MDYCSSLMVVEDDLSSTLGLGFYSTMGQGSVESGDTPASTSAGSPQVPVETNNMYVRHAMQGQHVGGLIFRGLH